MDFKMSTEAVSEPCELCRIGLSQPTTATYIYWVNKQVLVLPNAPAYLCDICGQLRYDTYFLNTLDVLLHELEYGLPAREPARRPLAGQQVAGLQPTRGR
jgi:YgiT-type zinc finger domain-containing protein